MRTRWLSCIETVLLLVVISSVAHAETSDQSNRSNRRNKVSQFNVGSIDRVSRSADPGSLRPAFLTGNNVPRQSVGSALSPDAGIGKGASIDLSFEDAQNFVGQGRHLSHWWNGEYGGSAKVSLHFGYRSMTDTMPGYPDEMSGYNVYDAIGGVWPRAYNVGCNLQEADTLGWGSMPSLDVMSNGQVVMAAISHLGNGFLGDGSAFVDNQAFYQTTEFNCTYIPGLNTTFIDTTSYRAHFMDQTEGNYSRFPQVVTQWDGSNTIVHLLLLENIGEPLYGNDYVNDDIYYSCAYFRKTGEAADVGSWSAGQIIDSLWFPWVSMAAAPYPFTNVAVSYTNPSYYGALLNFEPDLDVWYRESLDRGLTWQPAVDFTNYTNPIAGHPNHFTAWLESQCLYSTDGDLHVVWTAKKTSADPYFDGFNWNSFDQNVYHWSRQDAEVTEVANATVTDGWDWLLGSMNTLHCGYGGSNAGYIATVNIGECDNKLYCIWNQIHERSTRMPWRDSPTQPAPGILDNCSYTGERLAMANWEILMSVARLETSWLWDMPRNVTDTYTPNCGLPGDPEGEGLCASGYKPTVEAYGLDESGLALIWPSETFVDMNPEWMGPYTGSWTLSLQYIDDQFPGPAFWGRTNPPATLNSLKWIRLACVDPVEASEIRVSPELFWWPDWVELGQVDNLTVTVINDGNLMLDITEIGYVETTGSGWLSIEYGVVVPFLVPAGLFNTFGIIVDASGLSATAWLDGEVWIKSNALNNDSVSIKIHLLAAADVEPVVWDMAMSHANMFDTYFIPEGECVALAVSNHGEIGALGGSMGYPEYFQQGSVNLDYMESETECGSRLADAIYLQSGSAFAITADDASGSNAQLTCSYNHASQVFESGWDPIGTKGSIRDGLAGGGEYDSVYTGVFVNRDTTIAMERTFYAPRSNDPANETINYVICVSKFYSGDGAGHNHVTLGSVCDWNVPSETVNTNTSSISSDGFVYMQGTDTTGVLSCQSHTGRFATEAFGGGYTHADWLADQCAIDELYHGVKAMPQSLMEDTTNYRDGTPIPVPQPNPEVWWDETAVPGLSADPTAIDQAIWTTFVHDYDLGATDTLYFWTVLTTVRDGDLAEFELQVHMAKNWYYCDIRRCDCGGCCVGRVGDANGLGGDEPTIGDVSMMIEAKFIAITCDGLFPCLHEADVNQSGGEDPSCGDITIGDISILIDYLFISGAFHATTNPDGIILNDCF